MISPTILSIRVNSSSTKWASNSPIRFKSLTNMGVHLIRHNNLFALGMELVFVHAAALLKQMLFYYTHLHNLLTFPAGCQHWAFFEKVNVDRFIIKFWVTTKAKVAFVENFMAAHAFFFVFCFWACSHRFSRNCNLFLCLLCRLSIINFLETSHESVKTSLSYAFKMNRKFITAHCLIQFT